MAIDPLASVAASIRARAMLARVPEYLPSESPGVSIDGVIERINAEREEPLSESEEKDVKDEVERIYKEGKLVREGSRGAYVYYHVPEYYLYILQSVPRSHQRDLSVDELWKREFGPRQMKSAYGPRGVHRDPRAVEWGLTPDKIKDVLRYYAKLGIVERSGAGGGTRYRMAETEWDAQVRERKASRRRSKKRENNPRAPDAKRLVARCQRLWTAYCNNPTKARLVAVGKHLEAMKDSTAKSVKSERARALRAYNAEFKKQGWQKPKANPAPRRNQERRSSAQRMQPPRRSRMTGDVEGTLYDVETGALVVTEPKPWTANRVADWAVQYMELGHTDAANEIIRQYITLASGLPSDARKRAMRRQGFAETDRGWIMENPRNGLRKNPIDVANWYMDEVKAADQADWKVTLIPGVSPEELAYGQIMYPIEVMPDELVPGNREILMNTIERVVLVDPMDPTMNWRIAPEVGRGPDRGKFWRTMAGPVGKAYLEIDVYRETLQG
jgi:hypothetical protein